MSPGAGRMMEACDAPVEHLHRSFRILRRREEDGTKATTSSVGTLRNVCSGMSASVPE